MYQDVKCISGKLFYEERDGKYYPCNGGTGAGGAGRGGGGGGGIRGIIVQDDGAQVNGFIKTLNFTGDGVTVTDGGGGKANIAIPGYVIASLTTAQREALVPTTALIVEDTDLDEYFKWSTVSNSWSPF